MKLVAFLCVLFVGLCLSSGFSLTNVEATRFREKEPRFLKVEVDEIMRHLRALEQIAFLSENKGSRSVVDGFNASAKYVMDQLLANTNFLISTQHFVVPIYEELAPPEITFPKANPPIILQRCPQRTGWLHYDSTCDYSGMRYGGNGSYSIQAPVQFIKQPCDSKSGFQGFVSGNIALMGSHSECDYYQKALNAQANGASGVLFYSTTSLPGARVRSVDWKLTDPIVQIPCLGISYSLALYLLQAPSIASTKSVSNELPVIFLRSNTTVYLAHTFNVLAEARPRATTGKFLMIGAHLDSVPEGPGLNDNGSGSSLVLALALEIAKIQKQGKLTKNVRFAWWGAEEIGLLGSRFYVEKLLKEDPQKLKEIEVYLNFDMEASPNYIRMIYDGSTVPQGPARQGSEEIQRMFENHFRSNELSFSLTPMDGGSDFLPFVLAGVVSGGLATGAGSVKSSQERSLHGGIANSPLDPCYHAPCDSVDNISRQCLKETSSAASQVISFILQYSNEAEEVTLLRKSNTSASSYEQYMMNLKKLHKEQIDTCLVVDEQEQK